MTTDSATDRRPETQTVAAFDRERHLNMSLLRLLTCGSVDDGKSTLIGRLLYDSKTIFEDQLEAVAESSRQRGDEWINLALITDGLRAEREQGITIDVAYRYFATPRRKFIIADTPGHIQYTRNMATGASTANLAIILIDARNGVVEQTRRHAFITSLLRIPHMVVCINKMDLVSWSEDRFEEIRQEFEAFGARLEVSDITFIPISALLGDNVVEHSLNMRWYHGPALLHHLEHVHIASDRNLIDCRFPVQWIVRPQSTQHADYRAYAGQVASGVFRPGDEVVVLPSGFTTTIESIESFSGPLEKAFPPLSVSLRLHNKLDISRGDMICRPHNQPTISQDVEVMLVWMTNRPLRVGEKYIVKHTTREARCQINAIRYRLDMQAMHRDESTDQLDLNEIGRVLLQTTTPLFFDPYRRCRVTGSLILIDPIDNTTVGAGMIIDGGVSS